MELLTNLIKNLGNDLQVKIVDEVIIFPFSDFDFYIKKSDNNSVFWVCKWEDTLVDMGECDFNDFISNLLSNISDKTGN